MALNILASGMVTPVGFRADSSCAAIRATLDGFAETRFMFDGAWLRAGVVAFPDDVAGREKLLRMAVSAVDECLDSCSGPEQSTALIMCLADTERPGRHAGLGSRFVDDVRRRLRGASRIDGRTYVIEAGPMGAIDGLQFADQIVSAGKVAQCVVVGVDSLLTADSLHAFHQRRRLATSRNSDGFLPGEGAAAVLVGPARADGSPLQCLGIGRGDEPAPIDSGKPLRAQGLVDAYRAAFAAAGTGYAGVDYRMADISGEQYAFKEAALAMARTMRIRKPEFDLWHPCDCVGNLGAATVPLVLGVALAAAQKGYAPGPGALCHFSADDGRRAALVVREHGKPSHPPL